MRSYTFLLVCLLLMGCHMLPPKQQPSEPGPVIAQPSETEEWVAYTRRVENWDPARIPDHRDEALRAYNRRPDDFNRMRLGYLLSRPAPSMQQLAQSREILAEISNTSELAPLRDLLDREIALLMQIKRDRGRILELEAHLEALKAIEEEMVESRESMEEGER